MQSVIWASLGVSVLALACCVWCVLQVRRANRRLNDLTPDVRGLAQRVRDAGAEETLAAIFAQIQGMTQQFEEVRVEVKDLNRVVSRSLRRVGLVRYDANEKIRGNLSFALCMLDNRDNGVLLTSVYDLEMCRVFVRGILNGKTQHDLMPEEAEAIQQALSER